MGLTFKTIYHPLYFKKPSGTSRGILTQKDSWFSLAYENDILSGIGECSILSGLSIDDKNFIVSELEASYKASVYQASKFPAVSFANEMLRLSTSSDDPYKLFDTPFSNGEVGIPINGLIWMGSKSEMSAQIKAKIDAGFSCIKMKIGAINFEEELSLLQYIRSEFDAETIELRVDANGAFSSYNALHKLEQLAAYDLHSIEQPIRQGQLEEMAALCEETPLPIALDEELIGIHGRAAKTHLLQVINPQYIILKPSLIGGFKAAEEWIDIAVANNIGWWATSALESNIGLSAIAQWTSSLKTQMPQGLGTGGLYTNNIPSPLNIRDGQIWYNGNQEWDLVINTNTHKE